MISRNLNGFTETTDVNLGKYMNKLLKNPPNRPNKGVFKRTAYKTENTLYTIILPISALALKKAKA